MNRMISALRSKMSSTAGTQGLRHLDNHLLRDIGMPERQRRIRFGPY